MFKMLKISKGISLIQLLVVIMVLSILSVMVLPNIKNISGKTKISVALENKSRIQHAVDRYYLDNNVLPVEQPELLEPGLPQQVKWDLLTPNYLNKKPGDTDKFYYWVDFMGTVWVSDVDSPQGVNVIDNGDGTYTIEWDTVAGVDTYEIGYIYNNSVASLDENLNYINAGENIYKWLKKVTNVNGNKGQVTINNVQENLTQVTVVVSSISKNGFKSVPTKSGYAGSILDNNTKKQFFPAIDLSQYAAVIYVDKNNGSDINGDGSENNPYASVTKAFESVSTDNTCVYIVGEGVYDLPRNIPEIISTQYSIDYIAAPEVRGKVIFNNKYSGITGWASNKKHRFIGIVFTSEYSRVYAYFGNYFRVNLEFYNCVFEYQNYKPYEYVIFTGNNSSTTFQEDDIKYYNCIFLTPNFSKNNTDIYFSKGRFINCAFKDPDFTNDPYNLLGADFDENYNIISGEWENRGINEDSTPTNIGLYGGKYSWSN